MSIVDEEQGVGIILIGQWIRPDPLPEPYYRYFTSTSELSIRYQIAVFEVYKSFEAVLEDHERLKNNLQKFQLQVSIVITGINHDFQQN